MTRRQAIDGAQDISVAVIGGGIGGLSAAISLLKAGYDVQVYEQTPRLFEVGAGINISPNASRLLIRLGLGDELAASASVPRRFHQRRWQDGRTLARTRARRARPKRRSARRTTSFIAAS